MVTAKNPILSGFYPDPSICRAGEDYYIVNSSFVYAPGVPIFHSRDLAHWEQIGNILERPEQLPVKGSEISQGIYAPTIRFHDGLFYMITTNVSYGGTFEGCPRNPIFTHRNLGKNYPVIYAGHGDLVEDGKGNWYVVMLASRPCEGHSSMGRETFLAKVTWENGWPVIAEGVGHLEDTLELPTKEYRFPEEVSSTSDHISFWEKKPDKRLVSVEEICEENYSLSHRPGMLRLYTKKEKISDCNHCSYFGIRQKNYAFYAETGMEFEPKQECETAGMVLYQNHENHLRMEIRKRADENYFVVTACIHGEERILTEKPAGEGRQFFKIRIHCDRQKARIWLFQDGRERLIAEDISLLPYTTEEAGGFVGCTIGMYASANGQDSSNYADFAWFVQNAV